MNPIRSFLAKIIDYAGLFPPASLPMAAVVPNYAEYLSGPDRDLLGRLIIPAARLGEFSDAAHQLMPRDEASEPWRLSVLAGDDPASDAKTIVDFNSAHSRSSAPGHAVCDAVEMHARRPGDVKKSSLLFPEPMQLFFEIAADSDPEPILREVALHQAAAKIRTGGVTEAAFPAASRITRFIEACAALGVPFKATAGLHHLLRSDYPLTYEPDSSCATMYGYLNLFLAAAFIWKGMPKIDATLVLQEQSLDAFDVTGDGISWRGNRLALSDLEDSRARFALSFGSCSF
ncbi:MAG TPA: hypothetical protein VJB15_00405, partial [Rhodothermia bacterium]|nr:hypothetical protein [Rhodothermia bacterium]